VTKNYVQQVIELKLRVGDIIRQKLLEVTDNRCKRMNYVSFQDITYEHGVVIDGWPLPQFCKPSSIGSRVEVQTLLSAWESGVTKFRLLDKEERKLFRKAYEQGKASLLVGLNACQRDWQRRCCLNGRWRGFRGTPTEGTENSSGQGEEEDEKGRHSVTHGTYERHAHLDPTISLTVSPTSRGSFTTTGT
ncbi:hypothetical protein K474DRAFT_1680940, partial [Panus rudis PR-1116 ss-1]